jgi:hypothetical protein
MKYYNLRDRFFKSKYVSGLNLLSNIYPIKYNANPEKTNVFTAGGNRLRSTGSEIFYIAAYHDNPNKFIKKAFSTPIYRAIDEEFSENSQTHKHILESILLIMDDEEYDFDYKKAIKYTNSKKKLMTDITLDFLRRMGKKSNTPYIRFDKVYHPEYGLIKSASLKLY